MSLFMFHVRFSLILCLKNSATQIFYLSSMTKPWWIKMQARKRSTDDGFNDTKLGDESSSNNNALKLELWLCQIDVQCQILFIWGRIFCCCALLTCSSFAKLFNASTINLKSNFLRLPTSLARRHAWDFKLD